MRTLVAVLAAVAALTGVVIAPNAHAAGAAPKDVHIVNLNLLHGIFCERASNACQAEDRVALLGRELEAARCPDVVGLQEINATLARILDRARPTICGGRYHVVFGGQPRTNDTERVLTTLPVKASKVEVLVGNFRQASRVVLQSRIGPIVLVVTHQDGDPQATTTPPQPCRRCPPPCRTAQVGAYECQTVAAAALADDAGGKQAIRVLMGDFNVTPTAARYQRLIRDGWVDSYLAAGNPECDPTTSTGCTSGRDDMSIASLKDPSKREVERIDFIFVKAPSRCTPVYDGADDADGDGVGTGLWNDAPAIDGPGGLAWTSDHTGVSADLSCARGRSR